MCVDEPVGDTGLLVAQQCTCALRCFPGGAKHREPVLVVGVGAAPGRVRVVLCRDDSTVLDVKRRRLDESRERLAPGDYARRATLSLQEEDAKARQNAAQACLPARGLRTYCAVAERTARSLRWRELRGRRSLVVKKPAAAAGSGGE